MKLQETKLQNYLVNMCGVHIDFKWQMMSVAVPGLASRRCRKTNHNTFYCAWQHTINLPVWSNFTVAGQMAVEQNKLVQVAPTSFSPPKTYRYLWLTVCGVMFVLPQWYKFVSILSPQPHRVCVRTVSSQGHSRDDQCTMLIGKGRGSIS